MVARTQADPAAQRLLGVAQRAPTSTARVLWLQRASDAWARPLQAVSACRQGCSHCCHIPVALTDVEARLIGERIGRTPAVPPHAPRGEAALGQAQVPGAPADDAGYTDPCPFLEQDVCSIYTHRPLACRVQLNMDADAALCVLREDGVPVDVPYADATTLKAAYWLAQPAARWADIRALFPSTKP